MHILETRGDVLIRGLWEIHTDAIIDVRFGDSDAETYRKETMDKLLDHWEKEKKDNYGKHCHKQWKNSPFVLSVDGMIRKEALVLLMHLSRLMTKKLKDPLSHVRGWVNGRIETAVTRSYSRMICGACLPSLLQDR